MPYPLWLPTAALKPLKLAGWPSFTSCSLALPGDSRHGGSDTDPEPRQTSPTSWKTKVLVLYDEEDDEEEANRIITAEHQHVEQARRTPAHGPCVPLTLGPVPLTLGLLHLSYQPVLRMRLTPP